MNVGLHRLGYAPARQAQGSSFKTNNTVNTGYSQANKSDSVAFCGLWNKGYSITSNLPEFIEAMKQKSSFSPDLCQTFTDAVINGIKGNGLKNTDTNRRLIEETLNSAKSGKIKIHTLHLDDLKDVLNYWEGLSSQIGEVLRG